MIYPNRGVQNHRQVLRAIKENIIVLTSDKVESKEFLELLQLERRQYLAAIEAQSLFNKRSAKALEQKLLRNLLKEAEEVKKQAEEEANLDSVLKLEIDKINLQCQIRDQVLAVISLLHSCGKLEDAKQYWAAFYPFEEVPSSLGVNPTGATAILSPRSYAVVVKGSSVCKNQVLL